ncbi:hypothetical protein GOQ30_10770 [Flavobacterium sp. TP390]|uniref:Uncharacterized protein n=1 Tax=Flavobacterium profundi TaxID=1774945 RepID=A0A6I4IIQ3_9FLAO|nr:contractile injection system tape measure protein [Flavobacterium profundi]MVO09643.1 hypothetical protein [Flavobacterium profundi]
MHLIQQHMIEIECASQSFGKELQNQLSMLLEKEFYPKLELLLQKYDVKNHIWNIDCLSLELPILSKKYWKEEFIEKSLLQIEDYLKMNRDAKDYDSSDNQWKHLITKNDLAKALLFDFLKTGLVKENSISKNIESIVLEITVDQYFLEELLSLYKEDLDSLIRWIFSIPASFKRIVNKKLKDYSNEIIFVLTAIFEQEVSSQKKLVKKTFDKITQNKVIEKQWFECVQWFVYLSKNTIVFQQQLKSTFFRVAKTFWNLDSNEVVSIGNFIVEKMHTNNSIAKNEITVFFQNCLSNSVTTTQNELTTVNEVYQNIKNDVSNGTFENNSTQETIYVSNGGLVLLHPFLKMLFEQLDFCTSEGIWKDKMQQHKAILLTQFLIDGSDRFRESDLILNKILCGFAIEEIVNVKIKLSKKEKQKGIRLLEAVKSHWKVMSTSSIEALQQTFLQREAKLTRLPNQEYELWIEEKGVDILLDQLPWGLGTIQTPWMENYLNCHWY